MAHRASSLEIIRYLQIFILSDLLWNCWRSDRMQKVLDSLLQKLYYRVEEEIQLLPSSMSICSLRRGPHSDEIHPRRDQIPLLKLLIRVSRFNSTQEHGVTSERMQIQASFMPSRKVWKKSGKSPTGNSHQRMHRIRLGLPQQMRI